MYAGVKGNSDQVQKLVIFKNSAGRWSSKEDDEDEDEDGVLNEQHYIQCLGTDNTEGCVC